MEFKVQLVHDRLVVEPVDIETEWNLKEPCDPQKAMRPFVDIETEWNLKVGNLTSQLFANIYLDKLDKYVKHTLGAKQYIRYMDDFIILSPDKGELRRWLADIEAFLRDELRLALNPKTTILAAKNGVDFVGYKHRATHRKVRPDSIKRVKRTIKKCESGKITKEQLQKSIQSWTGHAGHADSLHLRKKIIKMAADAQARQPAGAGVST